MNPDRDLLDGLKTHPLRTGDRVDVLRHARRFVRGYAGLRDELGLDILELERTLRALDGHLATVLLLDRDALGQGDGLSSYA